MHPFFSWWFEGVFFSALAIHPALSQASAFIQPLLLPFLATVLLLSWAVFLLPGTCVFQGLSYEPSLYIPFSLVRSDLHGCDFGLYWEILVLLCWFEIRLVMCRPSVFRPVLSVPIPTCPVLLWLSFYITNAKLMFLVMQTLGVFMAPVMF